MSAYYGAPRTKAPLGRRVAERVTALCKTLYVQVIVAVLLGALLGHFDPQLAVAFKPLGDAFIKAIKVIVTPIIFTTTVVGLAMMRDMRKIASVGAKALIYFEIVSTLALLMGMAVGNVWQVGSGLNINPATLDAGAVATYVANAKSMTILDFFMNIIPTSLVGAFVNGDILPVLFIAVLFGLGLCMLGDRVRALVGLIDQISHALFAMVRIIMYAAPFGTFGAVAFTIGKFGTGTLINLGELVVTVYVVSALFIVVVLGAALRMAGFRLFKVLSYFKDEILFVFAATSAETMIPRSMEKLEKLGTTKEVVGLVIPTGFSFNMDGTAVYMTISVLFMAHATNTHLSVTQQFMMLFVMLFTSKGAAGVTGGGFVALAATMPTLGVLPVAALTLLLGVDRFMAEVRAATNLTSNIIATLVVGRWAGAVDVVRANRIMDGFVPVEEPDDDGMAARPPASTLRQHHGLQTAS